jgi:hypothetical protein
VGKLTLSDEAESAERLRARGVPVEPNGPGAFVEVLELPVRSDEPRTVGRLVTDRYGRVPRYQALARPATPTMPPLLDPTLGTESPGGLDESISIDDVTGELVGLRCRFLVTHRAIAPDGSVRTFAADSIRVIGSWNGTDLNATIDGFPVPKLILVPEVTHVAGIRSYEVGLAAQRIAVERTAQKLSDWLARESSYSRNHALWEREKTRLETLLRTKQTIFSKMWVLQMMYNRFDVDFAHWTTHYNGLLSPATPLDPAIVKSIVYQESKMGTHGLNLMRPPSLWGDRDHHPVRSRFNLMQAIDSWGPQQYLMIREVAHALFVRHGLDALEARGVWFGMNNDAYAGHSTFMTALREFFEARTAGNNLMGTPAKDLHEDYGFWIRTGIRWLFEKYARLRPPTWPEAVLAFNGGGAGAQTKSLGAKPQG